MIARSLLPLIALCCSLGSGCALRFKESHFFKSVDQSNQPINYFRVKADGGSFLSSARYVSGCFDERALDAYFGEGITQPADAKLPPAPGTQVISLSCDKGGEFLMILSSNSDAIADQIGQLADNEDMANLLARLIRRDAVLGSGDAQLDLSVERARGKILAETGDLLIANVDANTASDAEIENSVLQYVNALVLALGGNQTFSRLTDLQLWVEQNRKSIGRAVR